MGAGSGNDKRNFEIEVIEKIADLGKELGILKNDMKNEFENTNKSVKEIKNCFDSHKEYHKKNEKFWGLQKMIKEKPIVLIPIIGLFGSSGFGIKEAIELLMKLVGK